ncbi:tail protein (tape measure) [Erwinia endophytica]|uniref:tail protein (tape measure) n=1 Tax=Erwinia endophytica TaxID=1563158 RepID=UPI0012660031|nr:tail protein (tape measure) [Erwinia endophytica]KAB8312920.1 tail protein (tape measure) [Erwinia endophytica]
MAGEQNVGSIVYDISADVSALLQGSKEAQKALSDLDSSAQKSGKGLGSLDQNADSAGDSLNTLNTYSKSIDGSLNKLNTTVSGIAKAMLDAKSGTSGAGSEFSRAEGIIESLGNQLAILEEAEQESARSAAILAAQLRAGSAATDEEKKKIAELTGRLYDMKNGAEAGGKSTGAWKGKMQQAGYQVQDFIVQVQGGQSALVAFSQQGSQLAGAFGPGGAIVGSIIALGSIVAGTLITSLNGGKNAMDALSDAADAMDKVITISQNGVAALSNKYANLARVNGEVATLMRNQALLEYNQAIAKIPKAISDASASFISFKDNIISAMGGGYASVKLFGDGLDALNITTNDYNTAIKQAYGAGQAFSATANSISNTVGVLADKFGISQQQAYELAKQLSAINSNPSPEAIQALALQLQNMTSSTKDGQAQITSLVGTLVNLAREAANAKFNVDSLKASTDNLTDGQKNLLKQSERNLALSKLQGEARAKLQAQYAAEDAGLSKDDPHTKQMESDAAATYQNTQAQKTLKTEQKAGATQAENIAQKLANLKNQADLSADSTQNLSRQQTILNAQQSLGKGATQAQIALAGQYAAKKWDTANALKAQAAAEKLLPENKENTSYQQDVQDLNTAFSAQKISQEQYNKTSERLEQQHQANLAKIRADAVVTPQQEAAGNVDPVQQLANENAQKLALIQQYTQQKVITEQNGLALMNAANTAYEKARTDAQWAILSQQSLGYDMLTSAVDSFAGNASNALTGLLTGTMSLSDAMRSLGNTVLNSVINSIVQMGVEYAKNLIIQQTAGSAAVAASSAQALVASAAWATPAALAATATLGGAAVTGGAALASTVAGAQALALAGARKNGGAVSSGSLYQVGEGNAPEIYKASNGSQYMIPGDNGSVISNKDISGSGSISIAMNVQNYSSSNVDAQATSDGNGGVTIDMIIADLTNGGSISQGITSNFNVKRTPRGQS